MIMDCHYVSMVNLVILQVVDDQFVTLNLQLQTNDMLCIYIQSIGGVAYTTYQALKYVVETNSAHAVLCSVNHMLTICHKAE